MGGGGGCGVVGGGVGVVILHTTNHFLNREGFDLLVPLIFSG